MTKLVQLLGDASAVLGLLACAVAGSARLMQIWYVAGIQMPTLFQLGIGLMVGACLAKLHLLTSVGR